MFRSIVGFCLFLVLCGLVRDASSADETTGSTADNNDTVDAVMNCTNEHWDEISKVCNTFPTSIRQTAVACLEEGGLKDMPCKIRAYLEERDPASCPESDAETEKYEKFSAAMDSQCMEKCLLTKGKMMKDGEIDEKETTAFLNTLSFIKERNIESEVILNFTECMKNEGTTPVHETTQDPACDKARIAVQCMQAIILESFGVCIAKQCEKYM